MVRKCCVPSCRSNYTYWKDRKYVPCFGFPKDDELKLQWLEAIPMKDFTPGPHSSVCVKHFEDSDIIKDNKYLRSDGTILMLSSQHVKLKPEAIPKIFPDIPEESKTMVEKDNENVDSTSPDIIKDFEDLISNYSKNIDVTGWEVKKVDEKIYFFILNCGESLSVDISVKIDRNLQIEVFVGDDLIPSKFLQWILPSDLTLSKWPQLHDLLFYYRNLGNEDFKSKDEVSISVDSVDQVNI